MDTLGDLERLGHAACGADERHHVIVVAKEGYGAMTLRNVVYSAHSELEIQPYNLLPAALADVYSQVQTTCIALGSYRMEDI
jgi:hypothetical protein